MKRLLRRLSSRISSSSSPSPGDGGASSTSSRFRPKKKEKKKPVPVPAGHVPVCVGEEGGPVERFAVRADLLGDPAFAALLRRAAHEYGYAHPGALRIPCAVADFRRVLLRLLSDDDDGS